MAVVYQHIRLDTNEIFYIGIGKTIKRSYSKNQRSNFWKSLVKNKEYSVEILYENLSWEEACKIEIELISKHGRKDLGTGTLVNLTCGGDGIKDLSEGSRKKMAVNKGKFGNKNYFYGKKHTEKTIQKNREAHSGKPSTFKGKKHKPESNQKNREAHLGKLAHNKNTTCINNGVVNKYISENELNSYLSNGWIKGGKLKNNKNI